MRLAACVNILAPCQSIYRWQDDVNVDGEVPLIIKTTAELYPALETYIRQQHPYALPEIIALDVAQGFPDYLNWVTDVTNPIGSSSIGPPIGLPTSQPTSQP